MSQEAIYSGSAWVKRISLNMAADEYDSELENLRSSCIILPYTTRTKNRAKVEKRKLYFEDAEENRSSKRTGDIST